MEVPKLTRLVLCLALIAAYWGHTAAEVGPFDSKIFSGQFQFADDSVDISVREEDQKVALKIQRFGGLYGQVEVNWEMTGDYVGNVQGPHIGTVIFENGQDSVILEIPLLDDSMPEPVRTVQVLLRSTSKGLLGDRSKITATIRLLLSDLLLGRFRIDPNTTHVVLDEDNSEAKVRVQRRGEGHGRVLVKLAALSPGEKRSFVPDGVLVAENEKDFFFLPSEFIFQPNQTEATFSVKIVLGRPRAKSIFIYIQEVRGLDADNKDTKAGNEIDPELFYVRADVVYPLPEVVRLVALTTESTANLTMALMAESGAMGCIGDCNVYGMAAVFVTSFIVLLRRA